MATAPTAMNRSCLLTKLVLKSDGLGPRVELKIMRQPRAPMAATQPTSTRSTWRHGDAGLRDIRPSAPRATGPREE